MRPTKSVIYTIQVRDPFNNQPRNCGRVEINPYYIETLDRKCFGIFVLMGILYSVEDNVSTQEDNYLKLLDRIRKNTNNKEYLKAEKFIYEKFI